MSVSHKTSNHLSSEPAAYEKYKASLNALFDNKSQNNKSSVVVSLAKERRTRVLRAGPPSNHGIFLEAVRMAATPSEITNSFNALLAAGVLLPEDEDTLSKGLSHRDPHIVMHVIERLSTKLETQAAKSPRLLRSRLENAVLMNSSSDVSERCKSLLEMLK